mgnify:CR=1 FL=1
MKIAHAKILQFQSIGPEITLVDDGSQQNQRLHHRHFDAQTLSQVNDKALTGTGILCDISVVHAVRPSQGSERILFRELIVLHQLPAKSGVIDHHIAHSLNDLRLFVFHGNLHVDDMLGKAVQRLGSDQWHRC